MISSADEIERFRNVWTERHANHELIDARRAHQRKHGLALGQNFLRRAGYDETRVGSSLSETRRAASSTPKPLTYASRTGSTSLRSTPVDWSTSG